MIINWIHLHQVSTGTRCYFPVAFKSIDISVISNSNMETVTWITGLNEFGFNINHKASTLTGLAIRIIAIGN